MNISNIPIYRGKDERRESWSTERLSKSKRALYSAVSSGERLKTVLALAEFNGFCRDFVETTDRSYSFVYSCRKKYLNGELGEVDNKVVKKLIDKKYLTPQEEVSKMLKNKSYCLKIVKGGELNLDEIKDRLGVTRVTLFRYLKDLKAENLINFVCKYGETTRIIGAV